MVYEIQEEYSQVYTQEVTTHKEGKIVFKRKHQNSTVSEDKLVGTVAMGVDHQPICVPHNATIAVLGKMSLLVVKRSYMLEMAEHNLPSNVVVNCSYITPKAGWKAVILINTTNGNIWFCHPLLAADVYEVELHPWQFCTILCGRGNSISKGFQMIISLEVEGSLQTNQVQVELRLKPSEVESTSPLPSFGSHPDTTKDYNFKDKVE